MSFLAHRRSQRGAVCSCFLEPANSVPRIPRIETLECRLLLSAPATLAPSGIGGGGWFAPAAISPANPSDIWMGTDMGELFHTTNGAATWTYPPTSQISQFYRSGVQFTSNPNVMWAINAGDNAPSKSTDGGNTWADAASWNAGTQGVPFFLYTDPNSSFIVCSSSSWGQTSVTNRVYLSTNGGSSWGSPVYSVSTSNSMELLVSGMFKNGNYIWISTSQGILYSSNNGSNFNMLTVPWNSAVEDPYSMGVSMSGTTIRFVVVTDNPNVFTYNTDFTAQYTDGNGVGHFGFQNVYTSDFNTSTHTQGAWTSITSRLPANELPSFAAMASGNISTIYLAGCNDINYGVPGVLKSTDGGLTWKEIFQTVNNANIATGAVGDGYEYDYAWAGYALSLEVCQSNVNDVIITDMFTAWMTTDGGAGGANTTASNADWKDITVAPQYLHAPNQLGTKGTSQYAGSADNTAVYNLTFLSPQDVFASMTDHTGVYSTDGGASWYYPTFNSGAFFSNFFNVTADYRTNVLFGCGGSANDLYKSWRLGNGNRDGRGGGLDYSTDGGETWSLLYQWTNPDGSINPLAQFVIDPNVAGRAYALVANSADGGIWVTNNLYLADGKTVNTNATWTPLAVPSRTLSAFNYGWGTPQAYSAGTYYAHDPNELTILNDGTLVATFDEQYDPTDNYMNPCSGIWVSTDGGATWTDRTDLGTAQSSMMFYTQHLTVDPQDPTQNTWYASVDYYGGDYDQNNVGVFKTTNRGATWSQLFNGGSGGNAGSDSVAINPDTGEMYVASANAGLFYSANKTTFSAVSQEPYGGIESVAFNPYQTSQVWVTTHGNGMQVGDTAAVWPSDLTAVGNSGHQITLNWSAVGGANSYLVQYASGAVNWTGEVAWTTYSTLPSGSTSANLDGLATNSSYYFRVVPESGSTVLGYSNIVAGPVLASATNVVASSDSPHEIDVAWQYGGAVLAAQFEVQRSTDSVNWATVATTANTSVTSYADTTAAANTFYYYRVVTISGATFQSAPSGFSSAKTLAAAGLIAYEGFVYGAGIPLNGQGAAGNGWADGWTVTGDANTNIVLDSASLTPPGNLATSNGGSISLGATGGGAERDTSAPLSSYGATLWASALIKTDTSHTGNFGSFTVGNVSVLYHDYTDNGNYEWTIDGANNTWWGTSWGTDRAPASNDTTYFVVLEITYNSGGDSVHAWIDPSPGATAPGAAAAFDYKSGIDAGGGLTAVAFGGPYYANSGLDEIRLGTTYAAVAPLALPTPPSGLAAAPLSGSQISLTWTNTSPNTTGYCVYRSTDGAAFTQVGSATGASCTATGLTPGTVYYFQVTAKNTSGSESGYSTRVTQMAPIAGDINCDGLVDVADYNIWAANVGATGASWSQGDLNGDGLVDVADYNIWAANVGKTASAGVASSNLTQSSQEAAPTATTLPSTATAASASVDHDSAMLPLVIQTDSNSSPIPAAKHVVAEKFAADGRVDPLAHSRPSHLFYHHNPVGQGALGDLANPLASLADDLKAD